MVISLLLAIFCGGSVAASDAIEIVEIFGDPQVTLIKSISRREISVSLKHALLPGDEIETKERQVVTLAAADGSKWKIAPKTRLKIQEKSKSLGMPRLLSLIRGSMWGLAEGEPGKDGYKLKIQLKTASMGVRGTEYLIETTDEFSALDVLKGQVVWGRDLQLRPGSTVTVKAGQRAELRKNGKGKRPGKPIKSKRSIAEMLEHYGLDQK
jgi:ferric-dicitrate binding protein FerR (iron transport regulator)